ncbi:hypothetical protein CDAR_495411 [Caerostris darwini]|uniref:Uncharacterized protein n=1 Tax=Caerostris darwini TaxID=1538125 RepID=A0AAV4SBE4_9ARAC|nr:hypothetical protein CDAR_495411 [Caerostris darwini]
MPEVDGREKSGDDIIRYRFRRRGLSRGGVCVTDRKGRCFAVGLRGSYANLGKYWGADAFAPRENTQQIVYLSNFKVMRLLTLYIWIA